MLISTNSVISCQYKGMNYFILALLSAAVTAGKNHFAVSLCYILVCMVNCGS